MAAALAVVRAHPARFAASEGDNYTVKNVFVEQSGAAHVRFLRTWRGLRVLAGDFVVHLDRGGNLLGVDLASPVPAAVSTTTRLAATAIAGLAVSSFTGLEPRVRSTELVVDAHAPAARLAWEVTVVGRQADGVPSEWHVVLDANTGELLRSWDAVRTEAATGHGHHSGAVRFNTTAAPVGFLLRDPTRAGISARDALHVGVGASEVEMFDYDNKWGDGDTEQRARAGVDAHYGGQATWDYYAKAHRYEGVDGSGSSFFSIVHAGVSLNNAYWSDECQCASFGDGDGTTWGPVTSLDVVAHEVTHGITSKTAGLEYAGESGGLNEATSDIFGTLVEFFANNASDRPDYLIGEKILLGGKPLRWMDDPARDGHSYTCWAADAKNVNVHLSSGIGNHFFYLLAVGSGRSRWGNSPTCYGRPAVKGIGNVAAGRIWFYALTRYMTSTTDYAGARRATLSAAAELYGKNSVQARTVAAAWRAVNVK